MVTSVFLCKQCFWWSLFFAYVSKLLAHPLHKYAVNLRRPLGTLLGLSGGCSYRVRLMVMSASRARCLNLGSISINERVWIVSWRLRWYRLLNWREQWRQVNLPPPRLSCLAMGFLAIAKCLHDCCGSGRSLLLDMVWHNAVVEWWDLFVLYIFVYIFNRCFVNWFQKFLLFIS